MSELNEEMKITADYAIRSAIDRFGLLLDFSDISLTALESILQKIYWELSGVPKDRGSNELIYNTAMIWGAYLGEFMRMKWGGTWVFEGVEQILLINNLHFSPINYIYIKILDHRNPSVKAYLLDANWNISASIIDLSQKKNPVSHVDKFTHRIKSKPTKKPWSIDKDIVAIVLIYGVIFFLIIVFIILLIYNS